MGKYKLVIFDLDGTILDTLEDLTDSVNYSLELFGFKKRSISEIRAFVGNGIRNLIEKSVPDGTDSVITDKVFIEFDNHYKVNKSNKTKPYDGISEAIGMLKDRGYKLAVVSNKADTAVKGLCTKYFGNAFDLVFGERVGYDKKPSPVTVNEVITTLGCDRENTVYIGDSEIDILTAKNANIDLCLVTWGFRNEDYLVLKGGEVFADTVTRLLNIIMK